MALLIEFGIQYSDGFTEMSFYASTARAIFGYGSSNTNISNQVSSTGLLSTDTTGVGTGRDYLAAAGYGGDRAIFG